MTREALLPAFDQAFPEGAQPDRLGLAVSGGSDSLALLYLAVDWGRAPLAVATVDHGLRAESGAEAARVAQICAGLGVPHQVLTWRGWDGAGNLQDQARRARYRLLAGWAADQGLGDVALGHTLDDQAETFLLGLSRGAGLDGLTGMRPVFTRQGVRFHRPLLALRRSALQDDLTARGVAWIDDPSNRDDRFDRIKARQALAALGPLGIDADGLGRTIANLANTRAAIARHLSDWAKAHVIQASGDLLIAPDAFCELPDDFARRVLNAALRWISGADYPPRSGPVMHIVRSGPRQGTQTLHGCLIAFEGRGIRISREPEAAARADPVQPGALWDGRWRVTGPEACGEVVRAVGTEGLRACPNWRETGLPRASLCASPAVWQEERLISAPNAGFSNGWCAKLAKGRDDFPTSLISH